MYLPTELRDEVSYEGGGTLMWSEREIKKLTALGDAVTVGIGRIAFRSTTRALWTMR
jgi:hypothetical protein